MADSPFSKWQEKSYSEWLAAMLSSIVDSKVDGVSFPTFPDDYKQRVVQGSANAVAMRGAHQFCEVVREIALQHDSYNDSEKVLDFGTGRGRTVRPFLRDFDTRKVFCVDPDPHTCITARECNPYVSIIQSEFFPPLCFKDEFFGLIISYSIFSHLPESFSISPDREY